MHQQIAEDPKKTSTVVDKKELKGYKEKEIHPKMKQRIIKIHGKIYVR